MSEFSSLAILVENLRKSHGEWEKIHRDGCMDPFWFDGVNLNLVRNHIVYYNREIRKVIDESLLPLPEICKKPVPDKVDDNYMVKADNIRVDATALRDEIRKRFDMSELVDFVEGISDREHKENSGLEYICRCAGRFSFFEKCIADDSLVDLRRMIRNPDFWFDEIQTAFEKLKNFEPRQKQYRLEF